MKFNRKDLQWKDVLLKNERKKEEKKKKKDRGKKTMKMQCRRRLSRLSRLSQIVPTWSATTNRQAQRLVVVEILSPPALLREEPQPIFCCETTSPVPTNIHF
jgi:hypothetical protein